MNAFLSCFVYLIHLFQYFLRKFRAYDDRSWRWPNLLPSVCFLFTSPSIGLIKKKTETQVHFIVQYEKIICVLHGLHK